MSAKGQEAISRALKADLLVLNTVMAGEWLDDVLKENVPHVLPKVLWWIHEMQGHYFRLEYVKHLPLVAAAMTDSHAIADYWKTGSRDYLRYLHLCLCECLHGCVGLCIFYGKYIGPLLLMFNILG